MSQFLWLLIQKTKAETDYYWDALTKNGGQESSCGWCKDKYGLSWQVIPVEYFALINNWPKVREKAIKNTLQQKKIILNRTKIKTAHNNSIEQNRANRIINNNLFPIFSKSTGHVTSQ